MSLDAGGCPKSCPSVHCPADLPRVAGHCRQQACTGTITVHADPLACDASHVGVQDGLSSFACCIRRASSRLTCLAPELTQVLRQGNGVARAVAAAEAASAGAAAPAARSPSLSAAEAGQAASPRRGAVIQAGSGFETPPPGGAPWAKALRASSTAAEPGEAVAPEEAPGGEAAPAPLGARSGRVAAAVAAGGAPRPRGRPPPRPRRRPAAAGSCAGEQPAWIGRPRGRPYARCVRLAGLAALRACARPSHLAPGSCEPTPSRQAVMEAR